MSKPMQIYTFDPLIYPIKLYVIKYPNEKEINELFCNPDWTDLNVKFSEYSKATTLYQITRLKSTKMFGQIIIVYGKLSAGEMAHEAIHSSRNMMEWLGEQDISHEANAYFVEWIVNCLDEVNRNKILSSIDKIN